MEIMWNCEFEHGEWLGFGTSKYEDYWWAGIAEECVDENLYLFEDALLYGREQYKEFCERMKIDSREEGNNHAKEIIKNILGKVVTNCEVDGEGTEIDYNDKILNTIYGHLAFYII